MPARFNYINAFPADAARYGIQTLSPQFFGGAPDFVVAGPNVGSECLARLEAVQCLTVSSTDNLGSTVLISGTVWVPLS